MDDLISRQALLKQMGEEPFNWTDSEKELQEVEDYRNFRNMVEQLPSVKPQEPKWIPVSERLPDEVGTYMTTVDYEKHGIAVGQRYYHGKGLGWEDDCVIAWMPLPRPYSTDGMASDKLTTDDGEPDGTGGQIFCP